MQGFATRHAATSSAGDAFRPDLNVTLACPNCQRNDTLVEDYSGGDLVCNQCGTVLGGRIIDMRSEWRTFADSDGDDPSRVGGPNDPLLDGASQLSSVISYKDNHSGTARALQRAAAVVASKSGEKTVEEAFHEIQDLCDVHAFPRVVADSAKLLFKQQHEKLLFPNRRDRKAIIAACIFVGCRIHEVERTFKEIVAISKVDKKAVADCFKTLSREFDFTKQNGRGMSSAASIVRRFCNQLGLPAVIESAGMEIVKKIEEFGDLTGRNPISVASAAIYFASNAFGVPKSVKEIVAVSRIADGTLRTSYKVLIDHRNDLLSEKWFKERGKGSLVADLSRLPGIDKLAKPEARAEAQLPR